MKILFVTNQFHPPISAGAAISSSLIYKNLKERGHDVDLLVFGKKESKERYLDSEYGESYREPGLKSVIKELKNIPDGKYDIIHQYAGGPQKALIPLMGFKETKTVTTFNWDKPACYNYKEYLERERKGGGVLTTLKHIFKDQGIKGITYTPKFFLYRHYSKKYDMFFAQTEAIKELYSSSGFDEERFKITPNFYDPEFKEKIEKTEKEDSEEIKILYVGRVSRDKGVHHLIKAFKKLDVKNKKLDLIGRVKDRRYPVEIPDDESIECRGLLPYNGEEILQAYRNADIFVHPGIWFEPFNRTILEAPLANTAMVISDIGGPPEVFPDESLIFQRGNVDDLKQKLQRLIEDEELRQELAEKARKKTLDKYSPENTVSKIEKYYRSII